jgi:hypothetical protein
MTATPRPVMTPPASSEAEPSFPNPVISSPAHTIPTATSRLRSVTGTL